MSPENDDSLDNSITRREVLIGAGSAAVGLVFGTPVGVFLDRFLGMKIFPPPPDRLATVSPIPGVAESGYVLSQEQIDKIMSLNCAKPEDLNQLKGILETIQQSPTATLQPTPVEATIAPTATESEADKAKDILYSFFNDTLGLTPGLDKDGKMIFTDRDGRLYHVDDIKNDECVEGFIVPRITVSFKGNEVCEVLPKGKGVTTTPSPGQPVQQDTPEQYDNTNTPVPPTHVPPTPRPPAPTNVHKIPTFTQGPKPTREKTATNVP